LTMPLIGWLQYAQQTLLETAEVLLDWLWFSVASSSASFAAVNPLLLQQRTGQTLFRADQLMAAVGENIIPAQPTPSAAANTTAPEATVEPVGEQAA